MVVFENVLAYQFFKLRSSGLFVSYDAFGETFVLQEAVILSVTSKFFANVNLLSKLRSLTGHVNPTKYRESWNSPFKLP